MSKLTCNNRLHSSGASPVLQAQHVAAVVKLGHTQQPTHGLHSSQNEPDCNVSADACRQLAVNCKFNVFVDIHFLC